MLFGQPMPSLHAMIAAATRWLTPVLLASTVAWCSTGNLGFGPPDTGDWAWTEIGGPPAPMSVFISNHRPLVVVDGQLLLGTSDGVWRRPLNVPTTWQRAGLAGFAVHALAVSSDGGRVIAAGGDPLEIGGEPTVWYSLDGGAFWQPAAAWPRGAAGGPFAGESFPFWALEPDPLDGQVIYGNLDADTVVVSVDGGVTWTFTDGATEPNFGYACVPFRPQASLVLLLGCELPLDVAWVGVRDVLPADRTVLPGFRMLFGGSQAMGELGNRRINSMAPVPARDDRVLVGVEGGLVELRSASGDWLDRADVTGRWVLLVAQGGGGGPTGGTTAFPYAYITAIAPLSGDGQRLLFGGGVNGFNDVLSLFETRDGGATVQRLDPPQSVSLNDPHVEQAWVLGGGDVLLVISQSPVNDPAGPRRLRVFRVQRQS